MFFGILHIFFSHTFTVTARYSIISNRSKNFEFIFHRALPKILLFYCFDLPGGFEKENLHKLKSCDENFFHESSIWSGIQPGNKIRIAGEMGMLSNTKNLNNVKLETRFIYS